MRSTKRRWKNGQCHASSHAIQNKALFYRLPQRQRKTSSAFGMVMRAMGYGQRVGIVQFIKGEQLSGEELFAREHLRL